jgi:hypothetical protein
MFGWMGEMKGGHEWKECAGRAGRRLTNVTQDLTKNDPVTKSVYASFRKIRDVLDLPMAWMKPTIIPCGLAIYLLSYEIAVIIWTWYARKVLKAETRAGWVLGGYRFSRACLSF